MKITKIKVLIRSEQCDVLFIDFDGASGIHPFTEPACAKMECAKGTGESYARERFPGVPVDVVNTDKTKLEHTSHLTGGHSGWQSDGTYRLAAPGDVWP